MSLGEGPRGVKDFVKTLLNNTEIAIKIKLGQIHSYFVFSNYKFQIRPNSTVEYLEFGHFLPNFTANLKIKFFKFKFDKIRLKACEKPLNVVLAVIVLTPSTPITFFNQHWLFQQKGFFKLF